MRRILTLLLLLGALHGTAAAQTASPAVVHDPPSNVRAARSTTSAVLCSITVRNREIRTYRKQGTWYETDACGARGWIDHNQVRLFTPARVRRARAEVRRTAATSAAVLCNAEGGVRTFRKRGAWYETDYCGTSGWIRAADVDLRRPLEAAHASLPAIAPAASCTADHQCSTAAVLPVCADALSATCGADGRCSYVRRLEATCPCYEGEVRQCPASPRQFNFCASVNTNQTAWQPACGPTKVACDPRRPACTSGWATTSFDLASETWIAGNCEPDASCPKDGETRKCTPTDPLCATGLETYTLTAGWSSCVPVGTCATPAPTGPPLYRVLPVGGPGVMVRGVTCFGSPSTGPARAMDSPALIDTATQKTIHLHKGGVKAMWLANRRFQDALVNVTFAGDEVTAVSFVKFTDRRGNVFDAASGLVEHHGGQLTLKRDHDTVTLDVPNARMKERLIRRTNLRCGWDVVIGKWNGSVFVVETFEEMGGMTYHVEP